MPKSNVQAAWGEFLAAGLPPEKWFCSAQELPVTRFPTSDQRPAFVFSFMRSGTHFLMNTLANVFGYVADPWMELENVPINFYYRPSVEKLLQIFGRQRFSNIGKSHQSAEFFRDAAINVDPRIHFFYIYRHPVDCLASYRHFLPTWPVNVTAHDSLVDLMKAKPSSYHARHCWSMADTLLDYWTRHVQDWLALATRLNIHVIRYEDLVSDFDGEVAKIGSFIGQRVVEARRPNADAYIKAGPLAQHIADDDDGRVKAMDYVHRRCPALLETLGYGDLSL